MWSKIDYWIHKIQYPCWISEWDGSRYFTDEPGVWKELWAGTRSLQCQPINGILQTYGWFPDLSPESWGIQEVLKDLNMGVSRKTAGVLHLPSPIRRCKCRTFCCPLPTPHWSPLTPGRHTTPLWMPQRLGGRPNHPESTATGVLVLLGLTGRGEYWAFSYPPPPLLEVSLSGGGT